MPPAGAHAVKVGTTEGDKKNHKQNPRQDKVEETVEHLSRLMQCRREVEDEIDQYASCHRHWQRPFLQKLN